MTPCSICARKIPECYVERHHLTPLCKKGKDTIPVCIDCGNQIHNLFSNRELKEQYNTVEALKNNPDMQKWIRWIRKRKEFGICMKIKKRR